MGTGRSARKWNRIQLAVGGARIKKKFIVDNDCWEKDKGSLQTFSNLLNEYRDGRHNEILQDLGLVPLLTPLHIISVAQMRNSGLMNNGMWILGQKYKAGGSKNLVLKSLPHSGSEELRINKELFPDALLPSKMDPGAIERSTCIWRATDNDCGKIPIPSAKHCNDYYYCKEEEEGATATAHMCRNPSGSPDNGQ